MRKDRPEGSSHNRGHVDLGGYAHLFTPTGDPMGLFRVHDLTSRGALLHGRSICKAGERVHVMLALPTSHEPMALWGDVQDVGEDDLGMGVELRFCDLSADDEDIIEDAILTEWTRLHPE